MTLQTKVYKHKSPKETSECLQQISAANIMLQQAACRSWSPVELLQHYTELFVFIHNAALLECIIDTAMVLQTE